MSSIKEDRVHQPAGNESEAACYQQRAEIQSQHRIAMTPYIAPAQADDRSPYGEQRERDKQDGSS
jgi:hypothetical protein